MNTFSRAVALLLVLATSAGAQDLSSIDIPYEKHVLENGLTVLIHEDHSAPQAFVSVYYRVGSRDETRGKTGFAHLFEHLMFNGSENQDTDYFAPVQDVGGNLNGDTWFDRTRYYQTIPNTALDRILWLESDRMGHLLGAVTQEKLDNQIGVVQNEKRRSDNNPYGMLNYNVLEGLFPEGHPYRWSTIGSLADLSAASLDDVHAWFKAKYGAANAIVTIAGDVDSAEVLKSVKLYFGDIPAGPPVNHLDDWVPVRTANTYEVMQDRVPNRLISRNWVAPGRDHRESALLSLAAEILGGDESSRLYRRLVKEEKLAVAVRFGAQAHDLASMPGLSVYLIPGADQAAAERVIDEELNRFRREGPSKEELELTKTAMSARTIRGLDSIGSKAITLAESLYYMGSPDAYKTRFAWTEEATTGDVRAAADRWLGDGYHQVLVETYGDYSAVEEGADRSAMPAVDSYPSATAPTVIDHELSNGVKVRFVERPGVPAVTVAAHFPVTAVTTSISRPEALSMALSMLEKGTDKRSVEDIQKALKRTGSTLNAGAGLGGTNITMSTLASQIDDAAELLADVIRNPSFPENELLVLKDLAITNIEFAKSTPRSLASRYANQVTYGDHPYGSRPATKADYETMSVADLDAVHDAWIRPDQMTLFVVGGIAQEDLFDALEAAFGRWKAKGTAPDLPDISKMPASGASRVILFDAADAPQSNIVGTRVIEPPYGADHETFEMASKIYGGSFLSRINMNIREDKGWSYGVRAGAGRTPGPRLFQITAQVQTDKTAESIVELMRELDQIAGERPITEDELTAARNDTVRGLPGDLASANGVLNYMIANHTYDRADDYIETVKAAYDAVAVDDLAGSLHRQVDANGLTWFIAGDISEIEDAVRALNIGEVEVWDADGNRLR